MMLFKRTEKSTTTKTILKSTKESESKVFLMIGKYKTGLVQEESGAGKRMLSIILNSRFSTWEKSTRNFSSRTLA